MTLARRDILVACERAAVLEKSWDIHISKRAAIGGYA